MKVETVKTVTEVSITLSLDEAESLRDALGRASGPVTFSLYSALCAEIGDQP